MKKYFSHGKNATGWRELARWLKDLEHFKNSTETFRGGKWHSGTGWLNSDSEFARTFEARGNAGVIDYVVYSYQTPIAWHDKEDGWINPGHSYSKTTAGKHYGPTNVALSNLPE